MDGKEEVHCILNLMIMVFCKLHNYGRRKFVKGKEHLLHLIGINFASDKKRVNFTELFYSLSKIQVLIVIW